MSFKDKVVLITGAGQGIGFAVAKAFRSAGSIIALNDIDPDLCRRSASTIGAYPYPADVSDPAAMRQLAAQIQHEHGTPSIALCLAGVTLNGLFLDYDPEQFDQLIGVNLRGTYFTAQACARLMVKHHIRDGRIILMGSVTGIQAFDDLGTYGVSKAAIRMMARSMALELGQYGITVNCVAPGATLTERTASDPEYAVGWEGVTPNRRVGTVEDVTAAILFLCSPEARHITGQTLVIDGGWTNYSPLPLIE